VREKNLRAVGSEQEERAALFLQKEGYEILERNYQTRFAELDIVAQEQGYLCFVEVKYRKNDRYGAPEGVISGKKMRSICSASRAYMRDRQVSPDSRIRYDVVLMIGEEIRLIRNAFFYVGN
jgi:putative endonuclease